MPLWQWLLDIVGVLLALVLLYGIALVDPPPGALAPRWHLRAQLPRPARKGRTRLASGARALLRGRPGVVPHLLALAAAQARLAARRADLRRPSVTRGGRAGVALPRPRGSLAAPLRPAALELAMGESSLTGFQAWLESGAARSRPAVIVRPCGE